MDDKRNREYSRAPEVEDLLRLCQALNDEGVKYLLIGGFAVILHGAVRATKDIDLLIDSSEENVQRIKKAMSHLPDNAISLIQDNEVEKYQVVRIADEFVVDLMEAACEIKYEEALREVEWKEIEGVKIPIANKKILIKMKNSIRPSDKMDVNFLQQLLLAEAKQKK